MEMQIYHADNPTFGFGPTTWPEDFTLVAKVEGNDADRAFELTNHIDRPWFENAGVTVVKASRSTSVGDVVVMPDGKTYLCESIGWTEIKEKTP